MSSQTSQFDLLKQRRFAPLFWVQFLGAANDNIFKYAFTLLATYSAAQWGDVPAHLAGFVIGALFIAPYLLFSATSGQLADKFDKTWLTRRVKEAEIIIMLVAAMGFVLAMPALLYICVFLMGLHSTVFGPVKYAYLPQHLNSHELTGGNGLVEMGTFVAILLGTITGGLLVNHMGIDTRAGLVIAGTVVLIAVIGRLMAQAMPPSPAPAPSLRMNWNPVSETWHNLRLARQQPAVFNSLLGISWLWFFGSLFLTSFPTFARDNIGGSPALSTLLLAVFSAGIGVGSLWCERLSGRKVEIGLVPFGSIGMTVFAVDLYFASRHFPVLYDAGIMEFLAAAGAWRIVLDLFFLALFAGLYSVPLYALIQQRAEKHHTARIIAANNILNALFMIAAALMAAGLLSLGWSIPELFLVTGLLNALVALYIYRLVPEFLLRFLAWILIHTLYRVRAINAERLPERGAAVLVCNHVSFVDAIVIMAESPRPIRFVMHHTIFKIPVMNWFFKHAKAIAIAPAREDPQMLERANERIDRALRQGDLVCIFPEGRITDHGDLYPFKQGIRKIIERTPVPVYPMALRGLWGSFFSRYGGTAFSRPIESRLRRGLRSQLEFVVGEPVEPESVQPEDLQQRVRQLRGSQR